jgi:hypothetical protein
MVRLGGVGVLVASLASITAVGDAGAQDDPPPDLTAESLSPVEVISGNKSATSSLARTDPALLGRTDSTPVQVMIKLDYDSIAAYQGNLPGLAATSPSVTGQPLSGRSTAERRYERFAAGHEAQFEAELAQTVPQADVGQSLRTVYGGVAATVPANQIEDVLAISNVVAVQQDRLLQLETDSSPAFIGAPTMYDALGATPSDAGEGVIFGVLDSGMWPEHPSMAHQGNLSAPPAKADGTPRACNFGDNPLTPANDPFVCNNKLIGGQPFLDTYLSDPDRASAEPYHTARDSNGHGTHTASTAAGNALASAPVLGVERGPLHGIAPGAWVSVYKACGIEGCFVSDSARAVQQAILDGVKVINFSVGGGEQPFIDAVELAFLDAFAAGVFVAASAGNEGPGPSTVGHVSPWVTTVAASTQTRAFQSTLTLSGAGGATATFTGTSITAGVTTPTQVVMASAPPYNNATCTTPAAPGIFTGKIVACERTPGRVLKSFNVRQGGAAGMILYNRTPFDTFSDNHWVPTVHIPDGPGFLAFVAANPGLSASFTAGAKANGQGDVMASFSSRGPGGLVLKPDITAPGKQILAGMTPTPESPVEGPPGQYFQAIAGTSMSSPHIAGSAILVRALDPTLSPAETKSALMTTARTAVVKENGSTPADPFDYGAGRVDLSQAGSAGLALDETAADMFALGNSELTAVHLNIPSINATSMPGRLETVRTVTNVTDVLVRYDVTTQAPDGASITVTPSRIDLDPGESLDLHISIEAEGDPDSQHFGQITFQPRRNQTVATQHLPVAFRLAQGDISLASTCDPDEIAQGETSECTITASNNTFDDTTVDLRTRVSNRLRVVDAVGAEVVSNREVQLLDEPLAGARAGVPSVDPGELFGFIPLELFGITPIAIGDEQLINFNVPPFVYTGKTYTAVGIDSNGYLVVGGGTAEDNNCCNIVDLPNPARPNNMLAPFWTDLDGTGAPGIRIGILTDGMSDWLVVEWQVNVFGTTSTRHFQTWIGLNGEEDITFAYDPEALPGDPAGQDFRVGAENEPGTGGDQLPVGVLPTQDLRVTSTDPVPGDTVTYSLVVLGRTAGEGVVTTEMDSPAVSGTTIVRSRINITAR